MSVLSSLLGLDSSHNAGIAEKQSQSQIQLANQYGAQGANIYAGLNQQGQQKEGAYNSNYLNLLNQYGSLSGLGANTIPGQGGPGSQNTGTPQNNSPAGTNGVPQNQGGPQDPKNPYSLDGNQQALLNQSNAQIAQASKQAQAQVVSHLNASGITDPRAIQVATEQLNEHFQALQQETEAKFYEQIKTDKLSALQSITSGLSQYGQQGISEQEIAGSGYLGLAGGAQSFAGQQQNQANILNQNSQNQLGGLLKLGSFALGGGFGGVGGAAATAPIVSPLSNIAPTY